MVLFLPLLVLIFAFGCDDTGYNPFERFYSFAMDIFEGKFTGEMLWSMVTSWHPVSLLWLTIFLGNLATFSAMLPGEEMLGTELRDGSRLVYKPNGMMFAYLIRTES